MAISENRAKKLFSFFFPHFHVCSVHAHICMFACVCELVCLLRKSSLIASLPPC